MKFAWVENSIIRDVSAVDPSTVFHPDIAKLYSQQVPDNAAGGDTWDGATLTKVPVVAPPLVSPQIMISVPDFRQLFTPQERVALKTARATDPLVDDFMSLLDDPRLTEVRLFHKTVKNGLAYLQSKALLTDVRRLAILANQAP